MFLPLRRRNRRFVGHLEQLNEGGVCGWVIDKLQPRSRVAVRFGETRTLGRVAVADRYRADVQAAGLSDDGYCGFAIAPGRTRERLYLKLSDAHRVVEVSLAPASHAPRIYRRGSRVYALDRQGDWMSGYAFDLERPEARYTLELRRRGVSTHRLVACRFDARARPTPAHDGFHGFRMPKAGGGHLYDATTGDLVFALGP